MVEILVVLGTICFLAMMVFGFASRALERARDAQCIANLRTLYSSISAYKQDGGSWLSLNRNDPNTPTAYGSQLWFVTLIRLGYVSWQVENRGGRNCMVARSMICPSNAADPGAPYTFTSDVYPPWRTNYAMSFYWGDSFGKPTEVPGQYGRIPALGASRMRAILLIDSLSGTGGIYPDKQAAWDSASCKIPRHLHGQGCHALLADGSVTTISPEDQPDIQDPKYWSPIQQ